MPTNEAPHERLQELVPLLIDVQRQLDQDLSLESLAQQCGYSPFHFHRVFSREVGETPKQYVDRLRLERAAYKLAITGERILEVALSVGFKNHESFSRAFSGVSLDNAGMRDSADQPPIPGDAHFSPLYPARN